MKNICNGKNVIGGLFLPNRELNGHGVKDINLLDEIGPEGTYHYNDTVTKGMAEYYDELPDAHEKSFIEKMFIGDSVDIMKQIHLTLRYPSAVLGEERLTPLRGFLEDNYTHYLEDPTSARKAFFDDIHDVLDDIDTETMTPAQQGYFRLYKRFYEDGGELYKLNARMGVEKLVSNTIGNTVKSSVNAVGGNIAEGAIKIPTFYPDTMIPALTKLLAEGNLHTEIPEYAAKGIYGLNYAGEDSGLWEGLIKLTDNPLKNIIYTAAEMKEPGTGALAVQKLAFKPRFGDLPLVYTMPGMSGGVQLMGFTLNSYRLMHGMLKDMAGFNGLERVPIGARQFVTFTGLSAAIGGWGSAFPQGAADLIGIINPEFAQEIEDSQNDLGRLTQIGNINRIGIGYNIATQAGQKSWDRFSEGVQAIQEGDWTGGVMGIADAALYAQTFTNSPLGDVAVQKALRLAGDAFTGDVALQDLPSEAMERFRIPNIGEVVSGVIYGEGDDSEFPEYQQVN